MIDSEPVHLPPREEARRKALAAAVRPAAAMAGLIALFPLHGIRGVAFSLWFAGRPALYSRAALIVLVGFAVDFGFVMGSYASSDLIGVFGGWSPPQQVALEHTLAPHVGWRSPQRPGLIPLADAGRLAFSFATSTLTLSFLWAGYLVVLSRACPVIVKAGIRATIANTLCSVAVAFGLCSLAELDGPDAIFLAALLAGAVVPWAVFVAILRTA